MNTNLIHNILNLIGLIVGSLMLYDWTQLGFTAEQAAVFSAATLTADKVIKFALNIFRDGLAGLWKAQPPVQK